MTVTIDSRIYKGSFYGILNANGAFWTPLAFDSEERAWDHLRNFWKGDDREWQGRKSKFKVVPVRIQLTSLAPASAAATRRAETEGLGPKAGRAASEAGDAQNAEQAPVPMKREGVCDE